MNLEQELLLKKQRLLIAKVKGYYIFYILPFLYEYIDYFTIDYYNLFDIQGVSFNITWNSNIGDILDG